MTKTCILAQLAWFINTLLARVVHLPCKYSFFCPLIIYHRLTVTVDEFLDISYYKTIVCML